MKPYVLFAVVSLLAIVLGSCSTTNNCSSNGNFRIDYYSGGGFTGMQQGVTVACEGWAKFWKKMPASKRVTTDSVKLSSNQLKRFESLLDTPAIFSYKNEYSGNYTTHLVIMKDIQTNNISFNSSNQPSNFPSVVADLISELKSINKK